MPSRTSELARRSKARESSDRDSPRAHPRDDAPLSRPGDRHARGELSPLGHRRAHAPEQGARRARGHEGSPRRDLAAARSATAPPWASGGPMIGRRGTNNGARMAEVRAAPRQHPTVCKPASVRRIKFELLVILCAERMRAHVSEEEIETAAREYLKAAEVDR